PNKPVIAKAVRDVHAKNLDVGLVKETTELTRRELATCGVELGRALKQFDNTLELGIGADALDAALNAQGCHIVALVQAFGAGVLAPELRLDELGPRR